MVARLSVSLSVVAALGAVAYADKFTHTSDVKLAPKITDRAKPVQKHEEPAAPTFTAADLLSLQALVGAIHEEQISILKNDLIPSTPDTDVDDKADLYFRLGEIYAKLHQLHRLKAIETELALPKEPDAKKKSAMKAAMADHQKQAKAALIGSITTYQQLLDNPIFAKAPKIDTAMFYYAYTLQSANYMKEARATYDRLLKNYPNSRYVPDAHFAFGEFHFEQRQLADAEARYRQVLKFPRSSVAIHAEYKLGWVDFNLGKHTDALAAFNEVAKKTAKDPDRTVLHRAALKDFVRAYAEIGKADKALPSFKRVSGDDGLAMLAMLGDLYLGQGKSDKAIFVFRQLMAEKPTSPNVCVWEHSVARAMLTIGTPDDRVKEIEQLVKLYGALKTGQGGKSTLPKAEAIECRDAAAEMSGQLARAYHQEAVKTKNLELFGYAGRLYRAYLAGFKDAPDYGETQYFAAELGWAGAELEKNPRLALERWKETALAFTNVVESGKLEPKLVQVSADAAMLAWMKALAVDPHVHSEPVDDKSYDTVPPPKAIPATEQKLLAAYDGYLKHVKDPKDSERIDVMFHKANLLRRYDHLDQAIPIFEEIVAKHIDHETSEWSAQLVLDGYNRLQKYDTMLAFSDRLPKGFIEGHPVLQKTVQTIQRQAIRKVAIQLEGIAKKTGDITKYVACADKYLEAYNREPLADDADELLFNAGVCYEYGKSISAAKHVYETLQKLFPKSKLTARSVARLGNALGAIAYYREAAEKLEEYAVKYAGEKEAFGALSDAVQFRKGIGDDAKAIEDTNLFVKLYVNTHKSEAATAFYSLTAIYEKQGDADVLARHLKAYIDRFGAIGGRDRLVTAYAKLGDTLWQSSCPVKTVDGSCVRVARESSIRTLAPAKLRLASAGIPKRCGDDYKAEVTVLPRDERKVRAAMSAFGSAVAEYEKGKVEGDARGALYHYALARFGKVERDYEQYLAMPIPTGLDFDRRKPVIAAKAHKRFDDWFTKKRDLGLAMRKQFESIIGLADGATAIASAARLGAISQGFSVQLFRAEIPADLRTGPYAEDASTAYCEELEKVATPLEADALASYQGCLVTSTKLGWFSDWSRMCERELGQLQPERWPKAFELRRTPDAFAQILDTEAAPQSL